MPAPATPARAKGRAATSRARSRRAALRHSRWLVARARHVRKASVAAFSGLRALLSQGARLLPRRSQPTNAPLADPRDDAPAPIDHPVDAQPRERLLWLRVVAAWLVHVACLLGPRLRRVAARLGPGLAVLVSPLRSLGRGVRRRRATLWAITQRLAWWTALALIGIGGAALVDLEQAPERAALPLFVVGLVICAALLLVAAAPRLRWAAFALGVGHGSLALVTVSVIVL
ncbi:MAG: hypothetical protein R3A51_15120 [Nannocystaceae bacterium]